MSPYVGRSMDRKRNARIGAVLARIDSWNRAYPVGTMVQYWRGAKEGEPTGTGATRTEARDFYGQPVVWIEGCSGCVALTHVEPIARRGEGEVQS